jgi:3-oxoacyl-[acyl-carrier-protein] synthase II
MGVSVKRIVVTGMGIVSPLGCGVQHVWQSLLAGKSGITRLSEQLVADIPCKVAGQVPSIDSDPLHGFDPLATIPAKERKKMDRFIEFALVAAPKRWPGRLVASIRGRTGTHCHGDRHRDRRVQRDRQCGTYHR